MPSHLPVQRNHNLKAGTYELFADLSGYPDNIRRDTRGGYWVALGKHIVGVRLDAKGVERQEIIAADKSVTLSDVAEKDGNLWLGSVELDYITFVDQTLLD
ncbi:unnamed protein product [Miscanthus lutarioriparius]|uniref:Strictosidine synthase n=1 Tax=Miscanthus lutarioriparius TaxID=422564 RepID=A0A811R9F8_9POAL|nr:unnamed protein product [Miscanthus lutarioriparius]